MQHLAKPIGSYLRLVVIAGAIGACLILASCGRGQAAKTTTSKKQTTALHLGGRKASQQLAQFAACMKAHGVKLPRTANPGNGPAFSNVGIATKSRTFKLAEAQCETEIRRALQKGKRSP